MAASIFASLTPGPFIQCNPFDYTDPCAQNLIPFLLSVSAGLTGDVTFLQTTTLELHHLFCVTEEQLQFDYAHTWQFL